ncbi:hypothetical protein Bhyg_15067, partial [Pseudolycoriella hygida]
MKFLIILAINVAVGNVRAHSHVVGANIGNALNDLPQDLKGAVRNVADIIEDAVEAVAEAVAAVAKSFKNVLSKITELTNALDDAEGSATPIINELIAKVTAAFDKITD